MTLLQVLGDIVGVAAVFGAIVYGLYRVVGWARRRAKRAYVIGAALAPFMALGHVVDPEYRVVHEAKQHKKREEDEPGDPPDPETARTPDFPPPERSTTRRSVRRALASFARIRDAGASRRWA